jgi:hypothetical protein
MTKEEAAIITAYTGIIMGRGDVFGEFHRYAEHLMGRPVLTHEFASLDLMCELQERSKPDFIAMCEVIE